MTDYNIRYTNPLKTGFVIPEGRSDGPVNPNSNVFMPGAVAANTTLHLLGRGWPLYGEHVWQDLVYLTENFANSTPPSYPIEGQLWFNDASNVLSFYTGSSWTSLLSTTITANLNMGGYKIVNLGDPTVGTDAVNLSYLQSNYVNRAGDIMTGSLTMVGGSTQINLPNQPTAAAHATNKAYVDGLTSQYLPLSGGTLTGPLTINSTLTVTQPAALSTTTTGALTTSGILTVNSTSQFNGAATFSSNATFQSPVTVTSTSLTITAGGSLNMSGNVIDNVGSPVSANQAANKAYVDALAGGSAGQVITGGSVSTVDGVITLNTSGGGTITLAGSAAPFVHMHTALDVEVSASTMIANYLNSVAVNDGSYPTIQLQRAIQMNDVALSALLNDTQRYEEPGTGGTTVIFPFRYRVGSNKLKVYVNGVLQVLSRHATGGILATATINGSRVAITGNGSNTPYAFNFTVSGTTYTNVTLTVPASGLTYDELTNLLNTTFTSLVIPATARIDNNRIVITSNATGAGASILFTHPSAGDSFLDLLTTKNLSWTNQTVSFSGAYTEVGPVGSMTSSIVFAVAPLATDIITAIVEPHIGALISA